MITFFFAKRINSMCLEEECPSSGLSDVRCSIKKHIFINSRSHMSQRFRQQQQLKLIVHATQKENNDVIKI